MTFRHLASIIVIIGGGIVGMSLLADPIGFGNGMGFGVKQAGGAIAGVLTVLLGLVVMRKAA